MAIVFYKDLFIYSKGRVLRRGGEGRQRKQLGVVEGGEGVTHLLVHWQRAAASPARMKQEQTTPRGRQGPKYVRYHPLPSQRTSRESDQKQSSPKTRTSTAVRGACIATGNLTRSTTVSAPNFLKKIKHQNNLDFFPFVRIKKKIKDWKRYTKCFLSN